MVCGSKCVCHESSYSSLRQTTSFAFLCSHAQQTESRGLLILGEINHDGYSSGLRESDPWSCQKNIALNNYGGHTSPPPQRHSRRISWSPPHDSELYISADRLMLTVFERQARLDPTIWSGIEVTPCHCVIPPRIVPDHIITRPRNGELWTEPPWHGN